MNNKKNNKPKLYIIIEFLLVTLISSLLGAFGFKHFGLEGLIFAILVSFILAFIIDYSLKKMSTRVKNDPPPKPKNPNSSFLQKFKKARAEKIPKIKIPRFSWSKRKKNSRKEEKN